MKIILPLAALLACASLANAQSGPLKTRHVASAVPMFKIPPLNDEMRTTTVSASVDPSGNVTAVELGESTGSETLDSAIRAYFMTWKLIPDCPAFSASSPRP